VIRRALLLAMLASPVPALAQAYQCRAPQSIAMPRSIQPDGPRRTSPISGYTLAVSWSPEFCRGGGAARDPDNLQCNGSIGRFGFVLHGLWPESGQGKYPQWCSVTPRPSETELKAQLCMTPVPWLLEHEWAKHGSCMARSPAGYFKVAGILWNSVRLPDADKLSRQPGLTAGDLRREFAALNPGFPVSSVGIRSSNGGWLREIHLCYGKTFKPARCEARSIGPENDVPLKIWRGL
jgi:ribonuclease T2